MTVTRIEGLSLIYAFPAGVRCVDMVVFRDRCIVATEDALYEVVHRVPWWRRWLAAPLKLVGMR